VHGLRVQSRRLISTLGLVEVALPASHVERVRRAARACLKSLSMLRDTHVELELASGWVTQLPEIGPLLRDLERRERKLSRKARRDLKRAKLGGLERAMASLRKEIQAAARSGGQGLSTTTQLLAAIDRAFVVVLRSLSRVKPSDPATIHRVRVRFKKFRYMAEGAAAILEGIDRSRLQAMRTFQRRMGRIQDTEVLLQHISRYALRRRESEVMSGLRNVVLRKQARLIRRFTQAAAEIQRLWPPPRRQHLALVRTRD
jgi:CHAD domain-containing protein